MTRSWTHFTRGRFVRQARVGLGDLREEQLSRQGFAGPVAMLYRTDGPNEVVRFVGDYRPRQISKFEGNRRFTDSSLEGDGFEPSVPGRETVNRGDVATASARWRLFRG
jgi:hypothetical protein